MSADPKHDDGAAPKAHDEPLSNDMLNRVSGGGQDGNDLLIVNNGDGSDFFGTGAPTELTGESSPKGTPSDSEWKYVPVRRTT